MVDVSVGTSIDRPREEVAAYAANPDNAPTWYARIGSVEWVSTAPLAVGSRVRFSARFGGLIVYTYEVAELEPGRLLVMKAIDGPFAMETTYSWADADGGATRMVLRNRGGPGGLIGQLLAPLLARTIRAATRKDLARLKEILEDADRPR